MLRLELWRLWGGGGRRQSDLDRDARLLKYAGHGRRLEKSLNGQGGHDIRTSD